MEYKVNLGDPKTGKTYKKNIVGSEAKELLGKKISEKVKGDKIGFSGYEFEITGGSDSSGFPMRKDVRGAGRKRVLIVSGVGTRHNRKGMRLRRTVVGNTIGQKTAQINMKILKYGKDKLDATPTAEATPAKEDAPKETPKEKVLKEEAKSEVSKTKVSNDAQKPEVSDKKKEEVKKEKKEETKPAEAPKEEKPKKEKKKEPKEDKAEELKEKKPTDDKKK